MVLICYDGSTDARSAIEHAGELFSGEPATVLTVWEPFVDVVARTPTGFGMALGMPDIDSIDAASRENAERLAQAGVELARQVGLNAQPRICAQQRTVANTLLAEADEVGASAIVMGSRGLTGLKSLLLGSVSHAVIQHADIAVMVVPSPDVAKSRLRARRAAANA
jgi:nucleotide-binding universal stress UspA family protein